MVNILSFNIVRDAAIYFDLARDIVSYNSNYFLQHFKSARIKILEGGNRASPIPSECSPRRLDRQSRLSLHSSKSSLLPSFFLHLVCRGLLDNNSEKLLKFLYLKGSTHWPRWDLWSTCIFAKVLLLLIKDAVNPELDTLFLSIR